jgi:hypothetical protein
MHGEKNNLGATPRISQLSCNIDPARCAHGNVEQDEIRPEPVVFADDHYSIGYGCDDLIFLRFFKHLANMIKDSRIVVGQEDSRTWHRSASLCGWRCVISPGCELTPSGLPGL